jgi:hypothetical protein
MAGSKVSSYSVGDVNLTNMMQTLDDTRIGFHALTLTEFLTTTIPQVAAGSKVEVNGGLYKFDTNETIAGTPAAGDNYILLKPSGDTITAEWTTTAPTWSDSKQGLYGTGGNANYRYAHFKVNKSGSNYTKYQIAFVNSNLIYIAATSGDISYTGDISITGGLSINGASVLGALSDGTLLYAKVLTIAAGTGNTVNHGISSARTGAKIKSFTVFDATWMANGSTQSGYSGINYYDTSATFYGGVKGVGFNDTQFWIDRWNGAGAHGGFTIFVIYIA